MEYYNLVLGSKGKNPRTNISNESLGKNNNQKQKTKQTKQTKTNKTTTNYTLIYLLLKTDDDKKCITKSDASHLTSNFPFQFKDIQANKNNTINMLDVPLLIVTVITKFWKNE